MNRYSVVVKWSDEDKEYVALVPELPYVSALGPTREKAVKECMVATEMVLSSLKEEGRPLPKPRVIVPYSGQLRLRMPRLLHGQLAALAEQEEMSLNSYIVYLLTRASTAAELSSRSRPAASALKRKTAGGKRLAKTG